MAEARALGPIAPPKCKTTETRVCALALLAEMAEDPTHGESERAELISLLMRLHSEGEDSAPCSLWHYMPSAMARARCGYVGLKNLGATCYLNSLAQQLYMIPEFRVALIELELPADSSKEENGPNRALLAQWV